MCTQVENLTINDKLRKSIFTGHCIISAVSCPQGLYIPRGKTVKVSYKICIFGNISLFICSLIGATFHQKKYWIIFSTTFDTLIGSSIWKLCTHISKRESGKKNDEDVKQYRCQQIQQKHCICTSNKSNFVGESHFCVGLSYIDTNQPLSRLRIGTVLNKFY